jgi:Tfp pilus assembly protein PilO
LYAIGVLLIADFVLFGYLPSKRRLFALENLRTEQDAAVTQVVVQSGQLAALRQSVDQWRQSFADHRQRIPAERDLGGFLHTVSSLMQKHALVERVIEPKMDVHGDHPPCIPITMQCRGTFMQLHAFYQDLQNLPRLVRFEEVSFNRHPTMAGQVCMSASIAIFYQPETDLGQPVRKGTLAS